MSLSYPNLPGIEVSMADGGLILPDEGSTESMLIIAPSAKVGAPTEPKLARESTDAVSGFGSYVDTTGVVNAITAAWKAAYDAGNRRTFLLALEGADEKAKFLNLHSLFFGILADFTVDNVVLKEVFADKETPVLAKTDFVNPEDIENFPNVGGVVKYAYTVSSNGSHPTSTSIVATTSDSLIVTTGSGAGTDNPVTIAAGNYGIEELAIEIETGIKAVAALENFRVIVESGKLIILGDVPFSIKSGVKDALVVTKFTAGTTAKKSRHEQGVIFVGNFAELLKDYCEDQTINHNTVKGFLGVTPPTSYSLSDIKAYVDRLAVIENEYSGHVNVVTGPEIGYTLPGKASQYYTNGVVTYAALVTTLNPESATTNKPVTGISGIAYNLSLRQLNALSGNKFVSFRLKNGAVYVTDGVTTAPDLMVGGGMQKSDYTRLSTLRITHAAINLVRQIADPFVGEPANVPQRNALNAAIKSGLEKMREAGAIQDYRFSLVQERGAGVLGQARITLQLVPAFETKKISVNVSLVPLLAASQE